MTIGKVMVYQTSDTPPGDNNFIACMAILRCCGIPMEFEVNRTIAIKRGRGKINPVNGFIMITSDDEVLFNWSHLAYWIDVKGLRPMV